jgi:2-keto-3-deoxy-L-fuconate dehydrogenase
VIHPPGYQRCLHAETRLTIGAVGRRPACASPSALVENSTVTQQTSEGRFAGKRALVTMADRYTGPAVIGLLAREGATIVADTDAHLTFDGPQAAVDAGGSIDVLVVNLVARWRPSPPTETSDEHWLAMFDTLVHPTMRFVRAVLPQMIERRAGKIIVVTSAAPLRPTLGADAYVAARSAQNAYVKNVGAAVAHHNVQINAIAQAYVESVDAFQRDTWSTDSMQRQLRHVPAGRIAEAWEQAELVGFLASEASNFIGGQVLPFAGGWVT